MDTGAPILFYDGVCGLCDRLVQFVLRRDRRARFRFAALQSDVATQTLGHFGKNPDDLDTVYVLTGDGRCSPSRAPSSSCCARLGLPWSIVAAFGVLPAAFTRLVLRSRGAQSLSHLGQARQLPLAQRR